jgi:NADH-quinone oxidoreductase subunit G
VLIVGGDPANQQPVAELRARKAQRMGAAIVTVGSRPHALEALAGPGGAVRVAPGGLAAGLAGAELPQAERVVVLWDEADLAAEPDAADALARLADRLGALCLELGADVNGAGLRALGIPASGVLEAAAAGEIDTLLTVHADPTDAAGASEWGWALGRIRARVAIATHATALTDSATVVLPAATHYESEGVYVAMNGRAQRVRPAAALPQGAAPGWELLIALAHRLGAPPPFRSAARAFAAAAASRPALAGLSYDALGVLGAQVPAAAGPSRNGRPGPREPAGTGLPLVTTRPIFGDEDSHRSDALAAVRTLAELVLHPAEAARHGLADRSRARLRSPHGEAQLPVRLDDAHPEGVAYVAWGAPGSGVGRLLAPDSGPVRVEISRA